MRSQIKPLAVKNRLSGNPKGPLKYKMTAQLGPSMGSVELDCADPKSIRAMVALMDMQAVLGGAASHWGGPSALAEIWSALHSFCFYLSKQNNKIWHEMFHLINDAGHCENGLYALKANYGMADLTLNDLKSFRSIKSKLTGHGESHLFPEGVYLSNGPLGSSLPQAQGLAFAEKLSGDNRMTFATISDGACMEGEAKESLAAIPGLAQKGELAPFVMIISDNNTKLSGRITDAFSMQETFKGLESLGWKVISLENGNDLQASLEAIQKSYEWASSHPEQPVALWAKTVKGYGVKATAESSSGGHGFPLKSPDQLESFLNEIYGGAEVPPEFKEWTNDLIQQNQLSTGESKSDSVEKTEKIQIGVSQALIKKVNQGLPVVSVSSDLAGSTGTAGFQKACEPHGIDIGVAESNMVSMAAGLSKQGYIPVVDTFSQFGVTKGALPLLMANLSDAPIIAIYSHAGFQDAADGASHQALTYFAMTASVPNTNVYSLSCSEEAESLVSQAIDEFAQARQQGLTPKSSIFFLGRENFPLKYIENAQYDLKKSLVVADTCGDFTKSVTVATNGPLVVQGLKAVEQLRDQGVGVLLVNVSNVNQLDSETFKSCLQKTAGFLVTVEDHQVVGGMGSLLSHGLAREGIEFKLKSLGVNGGFGQSAYLAEELYQKHGLDAQSISQAVLNLLNN